MILLLAVIVDGVSSGRDKDSRPSELAPTSQPSRVQLHLEWLESKAIEGDIWGCLVRVYRPTFTDLKQPLVVSFETGGTMTVGLDYEPVPQRVVIPAGAWHIDVRIRILDDEVAEGPETLTINPTVSHTQVIQEGQDR